jgi:hypothetical protein
MNVYVIPLPEKVPTVPLVTIMSPNAKLVVISLNVAITENDDVTVADAAEVKLTVGETVSIIKVLFVGLLKVLPVTELVTEDKLTVEVPSI